jgi:PAS domain S-box-containing protein
VIFEDVTEIERPRATQDEDEWEQRYRELMKRSSDGIITMDETGDITGLNRSAEQMFGYPQDEVIGKSIQFLMNNGSQALVESAVKVVEGVLAFDGRKQNGAIFPAEMVVHRQDMGPRISITGNVGDLTERKRLEFLERDCLQVLEMVTNNKDLDVVLDQLIRMVERQHS